MDRPIFCLREVLIRSLLVSWIKAGRPLFTERGLPHGCFVVGISPGFQTSMQRCEGVYYSFPNFPVPLCTVVYISRPFFHRVTSCVRPIPFLLHDHFLFPQVFVDTWTFESSSCDECVSFPRWFLTLHAFHHTYASAFSPSPCVHFLFLGLSGEWAQLSAACLNISLLLSPAVFLALRRAISTFMNWLYLDGARPALEVILAPSFFAMATARDVFRRVKPMRDWCDVARATTFERSFRPHPIDPNPDRGRRSQSIGREKEGETGLPRKRTADRMGREDRRRRSPPNQPPTDPGRRRPRRHAERSTPEIERRSRSVCGCMPLHAEDSGRGRGTPGWAGTGPRPTPGRPICRTVGVPLVRRLRRGARTSWDRRMEQTW